ncbi:hypothetical protein GYH30_019313 [Glycine max]|nr:hypothetical protein GYH30_019313 [Glycine max]
MDTIFYFDDIMLEEMEKQREDKAVKDVDTDPLQMVIPSSPQKRKKTKKLKSKKRILNATMTIGSSHGNRLH